MADRRDPRTIITADAFAVAPHLLGLPLASPSRRAVAMLVDLALVAIMIKAVGFTFFALVAGLLLFRIAKPSGKGGVLRRGAAISVRIGAVLMLAAFGAAVFDNVRDLVREPAALVVRVENNDESDEDERAANDASRPDNNRADETTALPADRNPADVAVSTSTSGTQNIDAAQATFIRAYADAVERGDTAAAGQFHDDAQAAIAGARIAALQSSLSESAEELAQARNDLEQERERRGIRGFVTNLANDFGIGFGWMAVYFTAFVVLWNGRTPGKRLLGIRIIRLDAKPLSWWYAFERFGGYAASFSTGMLGFAQILWDRNRQGLHDKIIASVVIRERADRAVAAPPAARYAPPPRQSVPHGNSPQA